MVACLFSMMNLNFLLGFPAPVWGVQGEGVGRGTVSADTCTCQQMLSLSLPLTQSVLGPLTYLGLVIRFLPSTLAPS